VENEQYLDVEFPIDFDHMFNDHWFSEILFKVWMVISKDEGN
jgi:hypothetical protein